MSGSRLLPLAAARPRTRAGVHCPHFGACGGCSLLDRPYADELALKAARLAEVLGPSLQRDGAELLPLLPAVAPLFYRTTLKVPFGRSRQGAVCGFFRPGSHAIVDLQVCAIQHPRLTQVLLATRDLVRRREVPVYDERRDSGVLRHLVARLAPGSGQLLVGLVCREAGTPAVRRLAEALFDERSGLGLCGVVENVNARPGNSIFGPTTHTLCGSPLLEDNLDGLRTRGTLTSFVQVHAAQASRLYAALLELLGPLAGRHVVELYAGAGPIALRLLRAGARVTAIERDAEAAGLAREAARLNELAERLTVLADDAEAGLDALAGTGCDALVVDPPRRGLAPGLCAALAAAAVPRLAYVSCNPLSLARDLDRLAPAYRLRRVQPVDLFPRTEHLEVIALLERR